ncbi:lectin like domain-containing protein [Butyrivibrio sp. MC2021]|uniref:lectin like domain-containing protein n=1 Tax=Butyrivibrio sp. MC2021 TaxID=1408306 RepID=UPI000478D92C|nr:lectin like domain-containing protein [Butyrivibrio sp. MC2021]
MKKRVLAAILSGVIVATNAATAFATDGEELFLEQEEEELIFSEDETEDVSEEAELAQEEVQEEPEEESEEQAQEEGPEEAQPQTGGTMHATGHRSAMKFNITDRGGDDDEAFFSEEFPAKYVTPLLPPLRNQGNYGTCWAHASMGLLEINMLKSGLIPDPDFSELHLAYFYYHSVVDPLGGTDGDYFSGIDPYESLNYGGDGIVGLDIMTSWRGAAAEELVPYSYAPLVNSYGIRDNLAYDDVAHVKNYYITDLNRDKFLTFKNPAYLNPLKKMVMEYGAADISFGATDGYSSDVAEATYNEETGAYYNPESVSVNHEVVVVGWDDNYSKENFVITPPKDGAFLVRNSWADEGDIEHPDYSGYFWMSYYEASLGEQIYGAEVTTADDYDNNYQYDGFLFNGMNCVNKGANVFTAHAKNAEEGETLKAVSVFILDENTDYTVEVYRDLKDPSNPESGVKEDTVTGKTTFAGRYTIDLNKDIFLKPGETFAVVVTTTFDGVAYDLSTGGEIDFNEGSFLSIMAEEGQSFCYEDGAWSSMTDNLKIKAYTDNVVKEETEPQCIILENVDEMGVNLGIEENFKIDYTVYPISAAKSPVKITSSDPEIASVSGRIVTGVSEGNATITLETANGKTESFDVYVINKLRQVDIVIDQVYFENKIRKCRCSYVLDPEDYVPGNVTWESSNEAVATVDQDGIVTFTGLGQTNISVTVDGVKGSTVMYGEINDDQVYFEVAANNSVYIKWEPQPGAIAYDLYRDKVGFDAVSADEGRNEVVDSTFTYEPVDEVTYVEYTLLVETDDSYIFYSQDLKIVPPGYEPDEEPLDDWGDINDGYIMELFEDDPANIPMGVWYFVDYNVYTESAALESGAYIYTGEPVTINGIPMVYCKNKLLIEGRDYSLTYKNNVNASQGKASAVITGKGDYASAKAEFSFSIAKADLELAEFDDEVFLTVDKKKKTRLSSIHPALFFNGTALKAGKDFEYMYYKNTEDGVVAVENPSKEILSEAGATYNIIVRALENSNFEGERDARFIDVADFTNSKNASFFKLGDSKGNALKIPYEEVGDENFMEELLDNTGDKNPRGHVFFKGKELFYGKDYAFIYSDKNYKEVGTHKVCLEGLGEYAGVKYCTFEVTGYDISKAVVAGLSSEIEYTGYYVTIEDLFNPADKKLDQGWDKVTLYKNEKQGKTVLAEENFDGNGDYSVSYLDAKDAGKYSIVFTGINGCCGQIRKTFTIKPYDIKKDSRNHFGVRAYAAKYSKAGIVPRVDVTFGQYGELLLQEGVDYTLRFKNNRRVASYQDPKAPTVMVKGTGNFKGTIKGDTFTIFKGNANDLNLVVKDVRYKKNGRDGYFYSKYRITDGDIPVSVGFNKDVAYLEGEHCYYYYVNDTVLEDGTEVGAGDLVEPTERPLPGTEIEINVFLEDTPKGPYYCDQITTLSARFKITE